MSRRDQFERELSWCDDGHVSDLVVSALADGQSELVAEEAAEHVDECELCTDRLVRMASLSLSFGEDLRAAFPERAVSPRAAVSPEPATSGERAVLPARVPAFLPRSAPAGAAFPRQFFLLALALAALGVLPALRTLPALWERGDLVGSLWGAGHELLALSRGVRVVLPVVAGQASGLLFVASFFTTALCVTGGWLLARSTPAAAFERQVG